LQQKQFLFFLLSCVVFRIHSLQ